MYLQYMLQEGALYLPWSRARDIWGTLIANPEASEWDREVYTNVHHFHVVIHL